MKIRLGISACLLGENVRFDGGHKRDPFAAGVLSDFFDWVPVCPEVEAGMGTPREAVRLVGDLESPRMLGAKSGRDWTDAMVRVSLARAEALAAEGLDGYILKSDSPSCGMERVRVHHGAGMPAKKGVGLYARVLLERFPHLPVEEEGRLNDARLRENFIVRVFCHHRWRQLRGRRFAMKHLVKFHADHKLLLMAHSERGMRDLGRLVAEGAAMPASERMERYEAGFFQALSRRATTRTHTNVLQHIAGYFRQSLDPASRAELQGAIEEYRRGLLPLVVPVTLLRHHLLLHPDEYLRDQVYLNPHPRELMILNHV